MGDLNARIGKQDDSKVVGKYGEDTLNDSGERLIDFCELNGLQILNGFFQHKLIHRYTRERPSLQQKSVIDYIIAKQVSKVKLKDCRVKRGANCGSDHRLVIAELVVPFQSKPRRLQHPESQDLVIDESERTKYKLHLIHDTSIKWLYQRRLDEALDETNQCDDIEVEYANLKALIKKVAFEVLGEEKKQNHRDEPAWITDNIKTLIKDKQKQYQKWLSDQSQTNWNHYKSKNREVRAAIKAGKTEMWEQKCQQVESLLGGARSTEVWRTIRNMKTNQTDRIPNKMEMGKWRTHYSELLVENRPEFLAAEEDDHLASTLRVSEREVFSSLRKMKNGRSPGPGNIPAELLKSGTYKLHYRLSELFSQCCRQNKIPRERKVAHIVSIFKKGNRNDPGCYRGLSINSSVSRLFGKVLQTKLRESIGDKISEDQSGFTPGKSCTDNLFILQQLMEKKISVGQEIHLAFIDLEKAYDSIPRVKIWEALRMLEVNRSLLKIIKELYTENQSYVKVGHKLSSPINTTKGLRQGCSLSPLLFNAYVEVALTEWKRRCHCMGIPIGNDTLFTLSFADDQVVIAQDSYDLEFMTRRLYDEYQKWGLQVSLKKTEYLAVNTDARFEVLINDNVQIEQVEKFKYLGATINKEGLGKEEIQTRIQKSKQVIGCLNSLWWDRNLSATTNKRLGRTLVESVLCYGSELWTLNANTRRKIQVVEMDYLRRSAGISRMERKTNVEVRRIMKATNETVVDRIEKNSLKWFGHVLRMPEDRWPKKIFEWTPQGRRRRGRPRKSWNGTVNEAMEARNLVADDAQNRDVWRRVTGRQQ